MLKVYSIRIDYRTNIMRDSVMTCVGQPSIPDGYPTGAASGTPPTVTFVCNPGYTLSGNPRYTCDTSGTNPHWTGNPECINMFIKDGISELNAWFISSFNGLYIFI